MQAGGIPFFTAEAPLLYKHVLAASCLALVLAHHGWLLARRGLERGIVRHERLGDAVNAFLAAGILGGIAAGWKWPFAFAAEGHRWDALLSMLGAALLLCGTLFFMETRRTLGMLTTPAVVVFERHILRAEGPYAVSRHPMYTSVMLMALGGVLLYRHAMAFWPCLVIFTGLSFKARLEERLLAEHFGDAYRRYAASVPRFFPLGVFRRRGAAP